MSVRAEDKFFVDIHRIGRISVFAVIISFLAVPLLMSVVFQVPIDIGQTAAASIAILSFMAPLAVGEFLGYAPVLGPSLYLSLMTGNTVNMKIPAVVSSLQIESVDPQSKEGEIVKILAVGSSSIVVTVLLFVSMFGLGAIVPVLEHPVLQPAFQNVLPCMMGALIVPIITRSIKSWIFPFALVAAITLILGSGTASKYQSFIIIGVLVLTTLWEYRGLKRDAARQDVIQSQSK